MHPSRSETTTSAALWRFGHDGRSHVVVNKEANESKLRQKTRTPEHKRSSIRSMVSHNISLNVCDHGRRGVCNEPVWPDSRLACIESVVSLRPATVAGTLTRLQLYSISNCVGQNSAVSFSVGIGRWLRALYRDSNHSGVAFDQH